MDALGGSDPLSPFRPLTRVGSFVCDDPCVAEQATAPWDNAVTPLSGGPYRQENTFLATPRCILYRETIWSGARIQGLSPAGMLGFSVLLRAGGRTNWWGAPRHEKGLPATMPGGLHVDIAPGQQHLVALIDLETLRSGVPDDLRAAIERASVQQHVLPASREAAARLGAILDTLLQQAQDAPQDFQHPNAVRSMEQDLLAAFCRSLSLPPSPQKRVGRAARQRGLQRAVDYLRFADVGSITVSDLCVVARLTERTLEHAFRESFGLSPLGFLQLRRYHCARRALRAADGRTGTVQDVAHQAGFYHMGRFAVRYKALFGESPSQTLRTPPAKVARRLA